jgi:hypothetical protein
MQRVSHGFWKIRKQIYSADLLLYRGGGLIPIAGRGEYSHAAMAGWWGDHLMVLEMRELRGGRAVTLWSQVRRYPGKIDVYRPKITGNQAHASLAKMRGKTGHDYDYWGLIRAALVHLPVIRLRARPDLCDQDPNERMRPEFCSAAVASAYRHGAKIDPVPNLNDRATEPSDLARSPMFTYQFTLEEDEPC